MIVSLEAIFLTLFVLATQNRMTLDADRRAHLDLQVNLLSEEEMTLVLQMLREVCEHLELHETTDSPKFKELVRRTDVTALAAHVERSMDNNEKSTAREAVTKIFNANRDQLTDPDKIKPGQVLKIPALAR
jgi:uncharacterized membrane protein